MTHKDATELSRHPLMVCATLVQNPANLGGLCRTAEAFRLESLVLSKLAIARDSTFRNLAVSTHRWQPLSACPPELLCDWLKLQQQAGYRTIALHAEAASIPIANFTYPLKSVLLLGRELTGIPSEVLSVCDDAIAIPQYGMVDSLNVQTAAAIAIYEYVRQRGIKGEGQGVNEC